MIVPMQNVLRHKKLLVGVLLFVLVLVIFGDSIFNANSNFTNEAEETAVKFIENMLEGKAEKCVDLMADELIAMSDYETKKLFAHALEETLDASIESYKGKYGKRWKCEVCVIDSFDYEPEYYIYEGDGKLVKVVLEVEHTGSGLFNDKEGKEEMSIIMELSDGEWLVYDF